MREGRLHQVPAIPVTASSARCRACGAREGTREPAAARDDWRCERRNDTIPVAGAVA